MNQINIIFANKIYNLQRLSENKLPTSPLKIHEI